MPHCGWRLANENRQGTTLAPHHSLLHAVKGGAGTWQVGGDYTCTSR
jgi:hypothetical protein